MSEEKSTNDLGGEYKVYSYPNYVKTRQRLKGFLPQEEEKQEPKKDLMICKFCGNASWRVYITVIIDDARCYCTKCGKALSDLI
jgi:hypothetical protein